jgi:cytochrome c oxidase subunit 3|tara:strand:- start:3 stop:668 length:666 start_codon:yes stop_codon:yes gene_type:complete
MFATLREKSWLNSPSATASGGFNSEISRKTVALRFFLAVISVLFSLFIVTFLARSQFPDFQALAGQAWQPFTNPQQLWINTGILLAASIAIQFASSSAKKNRLIAANIAIALCGLFTLAFIGAQILVWQHLIDLGYFVASNPANSYFYLFTAIHGLHLVGGIFVLLRLGLRSTAQTQNSLIISTSLCANYWHYLLLVWVLLFALLTSTPDTYKTLAALCGF